MDAVLYHDCADGFGAAWAHYSKRDPTSNTLYLPCRYGEPVPNLPSSITRVYILDFSFDKKTPQVLADWRAEYGEDNVVLLDHHETAEKYAIGEPGTWIDMTKSGAVLAWEWFHKAAIPRLLAYVQDRDLWKHELPHSAEVNAWIRSYPREFATWDRLASQLDISNLIMVTGEGAAILRFQAQEVAKHVRRAYLQRIPVSMSRGGGEVRIPVVNATTLQSEIGAALLEAHPDALFSMTFQDDTGGQRIWSLRSRKGGENVAKIAEALGGGGHAGAAGFRQRIGSPFPIGLL